MTEHCNITKTFHPLTGDPLWKIEDLSLPVGGVQELIEAFIREHPHEDYSLSIRDTLDGGNIEIECTLADMPQFVEAVFHAEKGSPLSFVGMNSQSDSYVVGMPFYRGRIEPGFYTVKDGKLFKKEF